MAFQFSKHYTIDEAKALLPKVSDWIQELSDLRGQLERLDQLLSTKLNGGVDLGGETVNNRARAIASFQYILSEFHRSEIQLKDLDRGLVDFPHLRGGHEVFLCWQLGEDDITYWHELDAGYAGRELLD